MKGILKLFLEKLELKSFLVADTQLYKRLSPSVRLLVGRSVGEHESKRVKTRISAPAHLTATGGRVSGLVSLYVILSHFHIFRCVLASL